jgi:hypothetical protein
LFLQQRLIIVIGGFVVITKKEKRLRQPAVHPFRLMIGGVFLKSSCQTEMVDI